MPRGVYEHRRKPVHERFWAKVRKAGSDECWIWTAGRNDEDGYGRFMIISAGGVADSVGAHVFSYWLATGHWPAGSHVRHSCHNRVCVNPTHLSPGTHADNMRDMVEAGRSNFGERRYNHKLTWATVAAARAARAAGESTRSLARTYGVSERTMRQCLAGETWRAAS